jgi:hypothetical protein
MQWNEFIDALKLAKKEKKTKGISMQAISNLLFAGAMDSMIPEDRPRNVETYTALFKEAKAALKSKASLGKRRKGEIIGLEDVGGATTLALWRQQMNPLASCDILSSNKRALGMYGFVEKDHPAYPMIMISENMAPTLLSMYWNKVFENESAMAYFERGSYNLAVLGLVTESVIRPYADGLKHRLTFKLFTGVDNTDEITVWPSKEGKLNQALVDSIKPMELGFAIVKPKQWNGRNTATLVRWQKLIKS